MKNNWKKKNTWAIRLIFLGGLIGSLIFFHSFTFLGYLLKIILTASLFSLIGFGIDGIKNKRYLKMVFSILVILLVLINGIFILSDMNPYKKHKIGIGMLNSKYYENKFTGKCVEFRTSNGKVPMYWAYKESDKCEGLPTFMDRLSEKFE